MKHAYNISIEKYNSDEIFYLQSFNTKLPDVELNQIVNICNEDLVYNNLFKDRLNGKEYNINDAERFTDIATKGWINKTMFIFLIRDEDNKIVGCIDIKPNDSIAEIGYWISNKVKGVMTNVVLKIIDIAKEAAYESLFAFVLEDNTKSQGVLIRSGFINEGLCDNKYIRYSRKL